MGISGLVRYRGVIAAVVGVVAVGGVAAVGRGNDAQDIRLMSGAAWFASAKVGQVTLLDGVSAEVSAQVKIAAAGDALSVVQQGATAYTVNRSNGTIRRIDGATFDPTPPASPIADVRGNALSVIAGPAALYTLDTARGLLADTDPTTLDRRGDVVSVANRVTDGAVTVDDTGTLWSVDPSNGDVTRVDGQDKSIRPKVVGPGENLLVVANGHPVVVDLAARKAANIDRDNGRTVSTLDLDLRAGDKIQVSGSPHAERIYVVAARGVLSVCDVTAERCDRTVPLTDGNEFGTAVEAGNRVFVPNYTTGEVWIVDLRDSRVIAKPRVLKPDVRFQLMSHDGLVFYNDADSEEAGVIRLDGSITAIRKYDPASPDRGVHQPGTGNPARTPTGGATQPSGPSGPGRPAAPDEPAGQPPAPGQPPNQGPDGPDDPGTNVAHPTDPGGPPGPAEPTPLNLQIVVSTLAPTVDQPVDLTVRELSGAAPKSAQWTYGDGSRDGNGISVVHKWTAARQAPYIVSVHVTMADGRTGLTSVNITVGETPKYRLTVSEPDGGKVSGGGIDCPGKCSVDLEKDTRVTLTAAPDKAHVPGTWAGACRGATAKCDVTMKSAQTVTHSFAANPNPRYTLTLRINGKGAVSGNDISCPPAPCSQDYARGAVVDLTPTPGGYDNFVEWSGDCSGKSQGCKVTMDRDRAVTAKFAYTTVKLTVRVVGTGTVTGTIAGTNKQCGQSTCTFDVPTNYPVTFWADNAATLDHWTGPCTDTGNKMCKVHPERAVAIEAHFSNS